MIKMDKLKKLLECAVLTGFVKNLENPVSILLISNAESGKSQLLKLMSDYKNVVYTNDLSFKVLIENILPMVESQQKNILAIPDFINVIIHRRASESLLPALNSFMAEGIIDLKFYGVQRTFNKHLTGSVLTSITRKQFEKKIISFRDTGFLSRLIPITYQYSKITQTEIHTSIKNEEYIKKDIINKDVLKYALNSFEIVIPKEIADDIELLSTAIVENNKIYCIKKETQRGLQVWNLNVEEYGFRIHKALKTLIKGICLYNSDFTREIVNQEDLEDLKEFSKFMNFNFNDI